jgi:hypothetical protein
MTTVLADASQTRAPREYPSGIALGTSAHPPSVFISIVSSAERDDFWFGRFVERHRLLFLSSPLWFTLLLWVLDRLSDPVREVLKLVYPWSLTPFQR